MSSLRKMQFSIGDLVAFPSALPAVGNGDRESAPLISRLDPDIFIDADARDPQSGIGRCDAVGLATYVILQFFTIEQTGPIVQNDPVRCCSYWRRSSMRQWLVGIGVVACLIAGMSSRLMAADPPGHSDRNVIYITWDGFHWQEFFGGTQELFISKDAGVTEVPGKVAGVATRDVFPFILNEGRARIYVHAGITPIPGNDLSDRQLLLNDLISDTVTLWPDNQIDAITIQAAREYLIGKNPRVLFIGLGETDEWGHGRRYDRYLNAAHRTDGFLHRLWDLLKSMPEFNAASPKSAQPLSGLQK